MKNITIIMLSFLFLFACNEETAPETEQSVCEEPIGSLTTRINDTLDFNPRFVYFEDSDEEIIPLQIYTFSSSCLQTGSLLIYIEKKIGEQELYEFTTQDGVGPGETLFDHMDDDVILGEFDLYEEEEAQLEITVLEADNIEGMFSATYLLDEGPNRFTGLPDTLRFRNVSFRAELFK